MEGIKERTFQIISSKVMDFSFINLYEISKQKPPLSFKEKVTFTVSQVKQKDIPSQHKVVELLIGLKLVDEELINKTDKKALLSDSILRMSYLSKFIIAADYIVDGCVNEDVLKRMLESSIHKLIAVFKVSLSTFGFGNLEFPIINIDKLIQNNNK